METFCSHQEQSLFFKEGPLLEGFLVKEYTQQITNVVSLFAFLYLIEVAPLLIHQLYTKTFEITLLYRSALL